METTDKLQGAKHWVEDVELLGKYSAYYDEMIYMRAEFKSM